MAESSNPISNTAAESVCINVYGIEGTCRRLSGYTDHNFAVKVDDQDRYVLKIAFDTSQYARWLAENEAISSLRTLSSRNFSLPEIVTNVGGLSVARSRLGGRDVIVRMITFVHGRPLSLFRYRSPELLRSVGAAAGRLDSLLGTIDPAPFRRHYEWDLRHLNELAPFANLILDEAARKLVERTVDRFEETRQKAHDRLAVSLIHNDLNDANVFVESDLSIAVIDFGDMVESYRIIDPAVAVTYLMMGQDDPVAAAAEFISAYTAVKSVSENEAECLYDFIAGRLAMSVIMSSRRRDSGLEDPYLFASEDDAWDLLRRLERRGRPFCTAVFRKAAGFSAAPSSLPVRTFLQSQPEHVFPLDVSEQERFLPVDFSVGSEDFDTSTVDPGKDGERIREILEETGATCAIGRYNEGRLCYSGVQYLEAGFANRTIHLGIDVFKPAGTAVRAVLDGVIHSAVSTDTELDYGNVVIISHKTPSGETFYSLYGHLSDTSATGLEPGVPVEAGAEIGRLGDPSENGGWVPHLHFQFVTDLLGNEESFPGVASPDYRELWKEISPDPDYLFCLDVPVSAPEIRIEELLDRRSVVLAPNLSVSYRAPLHIVRGQGAYLFDSDGRQYLDCVNNVCHVGHGHPAVVEAATRQMHVLNTNTRYLHENILRYAEELASTLPEQLEICYFVNSGSEANDLALRLARAATARKSIITLESAYHGNLDFLIDISPYKLRNADKRRRHADVHVAALPDLYRDPLRVDGSVNSYLDHLQRCIEESRSSGGPCAFIAESLPGCAGQIELPECYLRFAYEKVRSAGGICIADEVQAGFGRVGECFWGFQLYDVIPDIVTMGKPIGNGHPLGAVVTTREIAVAFDNGMEYFNTFGGNPVSMAAGRAVLEVLHREDLQQHAHDVGGRLKADLKQFENSFDIVGDVRGRGFFLGIELVGAGRAPAAAEASYVVNRLRNKGILLSVDGPLENVLKFKPPMVFDDDDRQYFVKSLGKVLDELHPLVPAL